MRIWDIPVQNLCRQHLLGEHRELHCLFSFLTTDKGGSYKKHPETLRWVNHLFSLWARHYQQVDEMTRRGYKHSSPIQYPQSALHSNVLAKYPDPITPLKDQIANLKAKGCECKLDNLL